MTALAADGVTALAAEGEHIAAEPIGADDLLDLRRKAVEAGRRSIGWQARKIVVPGGRAIIRTPAAPTELAAAPSR